MIFRRLLKSNSPHSRGALGQLVKVVVGVYTLGTVAWSESAYAKVSVDVMSRDLKLMNDIPNNTQLPPSPKPVIRLNTMCVRKNLRHVANPLSMCSGVKLKMNVMGVPVAVGFPALFAIVDSSQNKVLDSLSDVQIFTPSSVARMSGARNTIFIETKGIDFSTVFSANGSYNPSERDSLASDLYFTQQYWRYGGAPVVSNDWPPEDPHRLPAGTITRKSFVAGLKDAFKYFGLPASLLLEATPKARAGGAYVDPNPPAPPPTDPGADTVWGPTLPGGVPIAKWDCTTYPQAQMSMAYKGVDGPITGDYSIDWSSDLNTIVVTAGFSGDIDSCGYISPLMLFFDSRRPAFTGRSTFRLFNTGGTIGWPEAGAPGEFLAFDKNRNGRIDDGSELFGSQDLTNGFEALAQYDQNRDRLIDSRDEIYRSLLLWNDYDGDGISSVDELRPLRAARVLSIDLNYKGEFAEPFGNAELREKSIFHFRDKRGQKQAGQVIDVWFSRPQ